MDEIYKIEITRNERLYVIGCFLAAGLLLVSSIVIGSELVPFSCGLWQIGWALVLGMWCGNGIRLEECRAARDRRFWR